MTSSVHRHHHNRPVVIQQNNATITACRARLRAGEGPGVAGDCRSQCACQRIELSFRWMKQHLNIGNSFATTTTPSTLRLFAPMIAYALLRVAASACCIA
ncbi:hypothetical protein [Mesorhizobium sp. BH1-1-4]|uniref:hypothetical protein n=1 Tax=Mesorhizobium sp. BH1-1-4 TaxID=2876662 RepID=UPI001CD101E3|nr:hypothetical protein [Mesorhizobium sp. BH1-1-4]MBZ9996810.1 hypothetical protein [Mesorhizobium sp. BH1-1-4]